MVSAGTDMTRRTLLRRGALGTAAFAFSGVGSQLMTGALASGSPLPPRTPAWRSRPDLKIPAFTVTHEAAGASRDPVFIAPYNAPHPAQAGAVIASSSGEPIWENPITGKVTTNFQVQAYRGSPVLTWWEGNIELGHGVGEYVIADTSYRTVRRVQAGRGLKGDLHEFVITPQGTALYTSYALRPQDLSSVGGPKKGTIQDAIFQEQDLATGKILLEWRSLDHIPFADSYWPVSSDWDFFHLNSVDVDGDGHLLISARNTHALYKLDRHTGKIIWRLGGKHSDFAIGPGAAFFWQHDARPRSGGELTLFDNGSYPVYERLSRGLILEVDEAARSVRLVSQYTHPGVLAGSQGDVQLLQDGNVFVGWGEVPRITEFERSGRIVFDAILGKDYECYRAFRLPWQAIPAEAPALVVSGTPGALSAYMSWNGATGVAAWRLLAGATPSALASAASARASTFETAIRTADAGPCFAAEALDAHGHALGRSQTVSV